MRECRVYVGDTARADAEFREPDSDALKDVIEPVTFRWVAPDGVVVDVLGARVSLGLWRGVLPVDQVGDWRITARSSGSEPAVIEEDVHVYPSGFGP